MIPLLFFACLPYFVLLLAFLWSFRRGGGYDWHQPRPRKLSAFGVMVRWHRWLRDWHDAMGEALNRGALEYRVARQAARDCADEVPACDSYVNLDAKPEERLETVIDARRERA